MPAPPQNPLAGVDTATLRDYVPQKSKEIAQMLKQYQSLELNLARQMPPLQFVPNTGDSALSYVRKTWTRSNERDSAIARNPNSRSPYIHNLDKASKERRKVHRELFRGNQEWLAITSELTVQIPKLQAAQHELRRRSAQ